MIVGLYIGRALCLGYLLAGAVLLALFTMFGLVAEVDFVGEGRFAISDAVFVVALTTPALLVDLAPFIAMLGVLYGLSALARDHEIVAVRAAGMTITRIVLVCVLTASGLSVLLAAVEFIARPAHTYATLHRTYATALDGNALPEDGFWLTKDDTYVNIGSLSQAVGPSEIYVFEFGLDLHLRTFTQARFAQVIEPDQWRLNDVVKKHFAESTVATTRPSALPWTPLWDADDLLVELPLMSLDLVQLRNKTATFDWQTSESQVYRFEFWRRCLLPLTILAFTLFSAPFVLALGPRGGHGVRVALGAFAAVLVYLAQQIGTNAALLWGMSPPLVAVLPGLSAALAGLVMIRRLDGPARP